MIRSGMPSPDEAPAECPDCEGDGWLPTSEVCPLCAGHGTVSARLRWVRLEVESRKALEDAGADRACRELGVPPSVVADEGPGQYHNLYKREGESLR